MRRCLLSLVKTDTAEIARGISSFIAACSRTPTCPWIYSSDAMALISQASKQRKRTEPKTVSTQRGSGCLLSLVVCMHMPFPVRTVNLKGRPFALWDRHFGRAYGITPPLDLTTEGIWTMDPRDQDAWPPTMFDIALSPSRGSVTICSSIGPEPRILGCPDMHPGYRLHFPIGTSASTVHLSVQAETDWTHCGQDLGMHIFHQRLEIPSQHTRPFQPEIKWPWLSRGEQKS